MAANNTGFLAGNLARDPEPGKGATTMARITVAVDAYNSSTKTRETDFLPVVAFGKTAEFVLKYFAKGSGVVLRYHVKRRDWVDTKTGEKRYENSLVADEVSFPPKSGGGPTGTAHAPDPGATEFEDDEEERDPFSLV